jgi:RNA polymerase sigma-70 factor (ECF subfamily)
MSEDDRQFNELYAEFAKRLVRDLERCGNSPEDAHELAHDVLLEARDRIDTIHPEARWVYLRTAARTRGINRRRNASRQRRGGGMEHVPFDDTHAMADEAESAEARLIRQEETARRNRAFAAAFSELTPDTRLCFILKHREHLGSKEIAQRLGMTDVNVRSRLSRAVQHLRERLGGDNDHD